MTQLASLATAILRAQLLLLSLLAVLPPGVFREVLVSIPRATHVRLGSRVAVATGGLEKWL
jgi:hypothetical protein